MNKRRTDNTLEDNFIHQPSEEIPYKSHINYPSSYQRCSTNTSHEVTDESISGSRAIEITQSHDASDNTNTDTSDAEDEAHRVDYMLRGAFVGDNEDDTERKVGVKFQVKLNPFS